MKNICIIRGPARLETRFFVRQPADTSLAEAYAKAADRFIGLAATDTVLQSDDSQSSEPVKVYPLFASLLKLTVDAPPSSALIRQVKRQYRNNSFWFFNVFKIEEGTLLIPEANQSNQPIQLVQMGTNGVEIPNLILELIELEREHMLVQPASFRLNEVNHDLLHQLLETNDFQEMSLLMSQIRRNTH